MKVNMHVDTAQADEHAELFVQAITPKLQAAADELTQVDQQWWGYRDKEIVPLTLSLLSVIRVEDSNVIGYLAGQPPVQIRQRLYQLEASLPTNFVRVSKGEIINIQQLDHLTIALNGLINVLMKDGQIAMVSRRYTGVLKGRLGL